MCDHVPDVLHLCLSDLTKRLSQNNTASQHCTHRARGTVQGAALAEHLGSNGRANTSFKQEKRSITGFLRVMEQKPHLKYGFSINICKVPPNFAVPRKCFVIARCVLFCIANFLFCIIFTGKLDNGILGRQAFSCSRMTVVLLAIWCYIDNLPQAGVKYSSINSCAQIDLCQAQVISWTYN